SDGPLSEPEVRRALGMSHRAASLALAQCEEWGLIERAEIPRRSGQRGPAATAWNVVDDHWEWFRRVARARKERETDPVLPFVERFDRGVEIFVRGDARAIEGVFTALAMLDDSTVDRLWALVGELGPEDSVRAAESL